MVYYYSKSRKVESTTIAVGDGMFLLGMKNFDFAEIFLNFARIYLAFEWRLHPQLLRPHRFWVEQSELWVSPSEIELVNYMVVSCHPLKLN